MPSRGRLHEYFRQLERGLTGLAWPSVQMRRVSREMRHDLPESCRIRFVLRIAFPLTCRVPHRKFISTASVVVGSARGLQPLRRLEGCLGWRRYTRSCTARWRRGPAEIRCAEGQQPQGCAARASTTQRPAGLSSNRPAWMGAQLSRRLWLRLRSRPSTCRPGSARWRRTPPDGTASSGRDWPARRHPHQGRL